MENNQMPGGYLVGNSHAEGGIKIKTPEGQIEAEGGEVIINKRVLALEDKFVCEGSPKEITSKINEMEGGVSWSNAGSCRLVRKAEDGTEIEEDATIADDGFGLLYIKDNKTYIVTTDTKDQIEIVEMAINDFKDGYIDKEELENTLQSNINDEVEFNRHIDMISGRPFVYDEFYGGHIELMSAEPINIDYSSSILESELNETEKAALGSFIYGQNYKLDDSKAFRLEVKSKISEMQKEYEDVRSDFKYGALTKDEYLALKKEIVDKYAVYTSAAERLNIVVNQGIFMGLKKDEENTTTTPMEQAGSGSILRSSNPEKRPSPSISATIYPAGYRMEGNDGNMWEIALDSRGIHRWKRVKAEDGMGVTGMAEDGTKIVSPKYEENYGFNDFDKDEKNNIVHYFYKFYKGDKAICDVYFDVYIDARERNYDYNTFDYSTERTYIKDYSFTEMVADSYDIVNYLEVGAEYDSQNTVSLSQEDISRISSEIDAIFRDKLEGHSEIGDVKLTKEQKAEILAKYKLAADGSTISTCDCGCGIAKDGAEVSSCGCSHSKYAKGGGVGEYEMYDERLYLDYDLKDSILENDTLSAFIKERHFIRDKNGKLFMWIDWMDYDQFDKLANFLGYKYAKGGGVGDKFSMSKTIMVGNEYMVVVRTSKGLIDKKDFEGFTKNEIIKWCEERGWKYNKEGENLGGRVLKEYEFFVKPIPIYKKTLPKQQYANGGGLKEISVYNLRKGDKVKTRDGRIETIIRKTGSGSYETEENNYSRSPESLEFISRPKRNYANRSEVGEELMGGQPNSSSPSGYYLISEKENEIIVSDDGGKTKERYVKSNNYSGYTLRYKGNQYEFMNSFANGGGVNKGKELWFSPSGELKAEEKGTAKHYIEQHLAKKFGAESMELVGEDEKDYIYELNGNPMMIAAQTALLEEESGLDIETYGRKKRVHIPKDAINQTSTHLRYPLITPFRDGGGVGTKNKYQVAKEYWDDLYSQMNSNQKSIYNKEYTRLAKYFGDDESSFSDRDVAEYIESTINELVDSDYKLQAHSITIPFFKLGHKYISYWNAYKQPEWWDGIEYKAGGNIVRVDREGENFDDMVNRISEEMADKYKDEDWGEDSDVKFKRWLDDKYPTIDFESLSKKQQEKYTNEYIDWVFENDQSLGRGIRFKAGGSVGRKRRLYAIMMGKYAQMDNPQYVEVSGRDMDEAMSKFKQMGVDAVPEHIHFSNKPPYYYKDGGGLDIDDFEMDNSTYTIRMWDTDMDKLNRVEPLQMTYKIKSQALDLANRFHYENDYGVVEVEDENGNRILTLNAYAANGKKINKIPNGIIDKTQYIFWGGSVQGTTFYWLIWDWKFKELLAKGALKYDDTKNVDDWRIVKTTPNGIGGVYAELRRYMYSPSLDRLRHQDDKERDKYISTTHDMGAANGKDISMNVTECQRCHQPTGNVTTMSMFNEDIICMSCKEKERKNPNYAKAVEADIEEIKKGNYNYRGIGYRPENYSEHAIMMDGKIYTGDSYYEIVSKYGPYFFNKDESIRGYVNSAGEFFDEEIGNEMLAADGKPIQEADYLTNAMLSILELRNYMDAHNDQIIISGSKYNYYSHGQYNIRVTGGQGAVYNIVPYFPESTVDNLLNAKFYTLIRKDRSHNFAINKEGLVLDIAEDGMNII